LGRVSWDVALPAMMAATAVLLLHLDGVWSRDSGKWDHMAVTTAQGLAVLLAGPGCLLPTASLSLQLFGAVVFWGWLGFLLDRRLRGLRAPIIRTPWLRGVLYSLGFVLACVSVHEGSPLLRLLNAEYAGYRHNLWLTLRSASPLRTLLGRDLITIAEFIWGAGYVLYFGVKLWQLATGRQGSCDSGPSRVA
jgi:hypothetical protein